MPMFKAKWNIQYSTTQVVYPISFICKLFVILSIKLSTYPGHCLGTAANCT